MRSTWWVVIVAVVFCGGSIEASDLPVPPDVKRISPPSDVSIGKTPMRVQGFSTSLDLDALREFYEGALPKAGWHITPLPWMAKFEEERQKFHDLVKRNPESANDSKVKEVLSRLDSPQWQEHSKRIIHATKGRERLILNISSIEGRTTVFVNRWKGELSTEDQPKSGRPTKGASTRAPEESGSWPNTNICCTDEQAPKEANKLPVSIPSYPGARHIGGGAAPSTQAATALFLSADPMDAVVDYYEHQMAYNGWTPTKGDGQRGPSWEDSPLGQGLRASSLRYQRPEGLCVIAISEGPKLPDEQTEKTIIVISWVRRDPDRMRPVTYDETQDRSVNP